MKLRKAPVAAALVCLVAPLAIAQSGPPDASVEHYVPRLADIMAAPAGAPSQALLCGTCPQPGTRRFRASPTQSGTG